MKKLVVVLAILIFCSEAFAQRVTYPGLATRIRKVITLPSDCSTAADAGKVFVDTDATSGQQVYVCEGVSGYKLQGDGGASGGDEITVNTTAATNANFLDNLYLDWALNTASTPDD